MRRTFLDREIDEQFHRTGFVVADLLDARQVASMRAMVDEIYVGERSGMHTTIQSADFDYRREVLRRVPEEFEGLLDELLDDHDVLTAALLIKWPGEETGFCSHQDWSMVDERRFRSVNLWCPLVDVDQENGALVVLPGSHRHLDHLRCSPMNPRGFVSEGTEVSYLEMDAVEMSAGQALIFDNGLLHGSGPNRTDAPRIVVLVSMKPREARIQHYFLPDGESWVAERYEVDRDFFADFTIGERPRYEIAERVDFYGTPRPKHELLELCGRERRSGADAPVIAPPELPVLGDVSGARPAIARVKDRPGSAEATDAAPGPTSTDGRFQTLRDVDLDAALVESGFVVVDLMDAERVEQLRSTVDRLYVDEREGFHASNLSSQIDYRRKVAAEVTPLIAGVAQDRFVDHEAYTASLLMKWPGEGSEFHTHQDWNMVDERRFRTVNVWCPLVDTSEHNGALRVLPGSHRVLRSIRCSPMPPAGCESVGWQVGWQEMEPVEVAAGQALIFDHGLLHSSGPNLSGTVRPAAAAAFKPRRAELFHWYLPEPTEPRLEVFSIDSSFFTDIDIGSRPDYDVVGSEAFAWEPMDKSELMERCGRPSAPETADEPPRAVLRDQGQQAKLDRDGWVVVPLLDEKGVEQLKVRHLAMDHEIVLDRSFARGFHATIMDGRPEYRREAHDAIAGVLAGPVDDLFVDMTLTLTNWLYKAPDSAAVPFHVDWTFVDERAHRSVSIWTPLVDTDEDSGCIGVVTGSHHEVTFIRAAAHPTYQATDAFGAGLPGRQLVPLRAGEAVVFDHRLVHFSTPHSGPEPRVAITAELVPAEAELLHHEWLEPGRFRRHRVRPEFFVTYTAGQSPREVEGHLDDAEVSGPCFDSTVGSTEQELPGEPCSDAPAVEQTPRASEGVGLAQRSSGRMEQRVSAVRTRLGRVFERRSSR